MAASTASGAPWSVAVRTDGGKRRARRSTSSHGRNRAGTRSPEPMPPRLRLRPGRPCASSAASAAASDHQRRHVLTDTQALASDHALSVEQEHGAVSAGGERFRTAGRDDQGRRGVDVEQRVVAVGDDDRTPGNARPSSSAVRAFRRRRCGASFPSSSSSATRVSIARTRCNSAARRTSLPQRAAAAPAARGLAAIGTTQPGRIARAADLHEHRTGLHSLRRGAPGDRRKARLCGEAVVGVVLAVATTRGCRGRAGPSCSSQPTSTRRSTSVVRAWPAISSAPPCCSCRMSAASRTWTYGASGSASSGSPSFQIATRPGAPPARRWRIGCPGSPEASRPRAAARDIARGSAGARPSGRWPRAEAPRRGRRPADPGRDSRGRP